jgi:hypothetical protein
MSVMKPPHVNSPEEVRDREQEPEAHGQARPPQVVADDDPHLVGCGRHGCEGTRP